MSYSVIDGLVLLLVTLCIQIEWLLSPVCFELFDVSFPEKLLKIVATIEARFLA